MKNLTIKDIAKLAGVSTAAVSFVINDKEGVSRKTREKIKKIIKQTGFTPNVHTRRLNLKRSFNINLAVRKSISSLSNMFYMEILLGILGESKNFNYNLVLTDISDQEREKRLLHNILNNDTDGIIFVQDPSQHLIAQITESKLPFIVVDTQLANPEYKTVQTDYVNAAKTSVEYLIGKGHKKIAYMGMQSNSGFHLNTFNGYSQAMQAYDLPIMPGWIQSNAYDEKSSYECMENILKSADIPTAVFCSSDVFAYGSMQCTKDYGLKVPNDISFIGMDDVQMSKYTQPALTTLSIDEEYMGQAAMLLIDKMINEEECESVVLSSTTIEERASVRDLNI